MYDEDIGYYYESVADDQLIDEYDWIISDIDDLSYIVVFGEPSESNWAQNVIHELSSIKTYKEFYPLNKNKDREAMKKFVNMSLHVLGINIRDKLYEICSDLSQRQRLKEGTTRRAFVADMVAERTESQSYYQ
nr:MAG: hypothetical protein [Trichoderma harzianum mononegavirus 2]